MQVLLPARGLLKHHFWGSYSATIGLWFDTVGDATVAASLLGAGWEHSKKDPLLVVGSFDGDLLTAAESRLAAYGADRAKMTSIATSIDHGEVFDLVVVGEWSDPRQLGLF